MAATVSFPAEELAKVMRKVFVAPDLSDDERAALERRIRRFARKLSRDMSYECRAT